MPYFATAFRNPHFGAARRLPQKPSAHIPNPPMSHIGPHVGTFAPLPTLWTGTQHGDNGVMGRGLVLWLVGIPLPVILILYFLGYLHG